MIKQGFRFGVKYVKHQDTRIGRITKFQIGDRIKDGDGFFNCSCTYFGDLPIKDGDQIRLKEIKSIEVRAYTDKTGQERKSFDVVVEAEPYSEVAKQEEQPNLPYDL